MKKNKVKKVKKNKDKTMLITLLVLLILIIILIPFLYLAEIKKVIPIVLFIAVPILLGVFVILLSRTCTVDYKNKKKQILQKIVKK